MPRHPLNLPFALNLREREELRDHFAKAHPTETLPADDALAVEAHAKLHPGVDLSWTRYGPQSERLAPEVRQHHELLVRHLGNLDRKRQQAAEAERKMAVNVAWKKLTDEDLFAIIKEQGPLTASAVASRAADLIERARAGDFDTSNVNPKLTRLCEAGKITKARFGDLPIATRRNVNGAYGTSDKSWVYGLSEQFVALVDQAGAIAAEKERLDGVFEQVTATLAQRYNSSEVQHFAISHGRGSPTVIISVDALLMLVRQASASWPLASDG